MARRGTRVITTRLRFEPGQRIPSRYERWETKTELGNVPVRVRLLEIKRTFEHPGEPGVMLMDARISMQYLA